MSATISPNVGFSAGLDDEFEPTVPESQQLGMVVAVVTVTAVLLAVYANMLEITSEYWADDTYSHGWLIPLIALFLMWNQRRAKYEVGPEQEKKNWAIIGLPFAASAASWWLLSDNDHNTMPEVTWGLFALGVLVSVGLIFVNHNFEACPGWHRWVGLALFLGSLLVRVYASSIDMKPVDRMSFLTAAIGLFAAVGGWPLIKRMGVPLLFLLFMFPLPSAIENSLLLLLQRFAAVVSTFILQVLGVAATRVGSTISIADLSKPLEVAEACSGLRMMTIFSAMAIALVLLIDRPWWDKLIILISALPISLATNIIRITVTALLYLAVEGSASEEEWKHQIHDWAGLAMIVIAMGFLLIELKILENLSVPEDDEVSTGGVLLQARS
jgi:exosortase